MTRGNIIKPASKAPRRRGALLGVATAAILLLSGLFVWLVQPANPQDGAAGRIGGPFTLTADTGRIVTERSFPDKYLAIYFGYTACQDVCPATLNSLTGALLHLGGAASRVQPLFITVDPARDTQATLHRYVAAFYPGLLGLTGTPAALAAAYSEFRVTVLSRRSASQPASYAVDHSSVIYLMAPDGTFAAPIPADASEMVMAEAIARVTGS